MKENKKNLARITLSFPKETLMEIDRIIESNFLTRTKWFLDAATLKLKKDKQRGIDEVVKGKI